MAQHPQNETTPLLWGQPAAYPAAIPSQIPGAFPGQQSHNSYYSSSQQYNQMPQMPTPFATQLRPVEPVQNTKKIQHDGDLGKDPHSQFCALTGCPATNAPPNTRQRLNPKTLYGRAADMAASQNLTYQFTAALTNTLLLSQIVLGAALTGLPATNVKPWVITIFGAANTIIAGVVTYLKSRGQPMRARMFRDDLERIVDEIENSEVMWLGIAKNVHGYDDIDTDDTVTVRSEVARLTRLLEKAIRTNSANVPELYNSGSGGPGEPGSSNSGMRQGPMINFAGLQNIPFESSAAQPAGGAAPTTARNADEAPATAVKKKEEPKKEEPKKEEPKKEEPKNEEPKNEEPEKDEPKKEEDKKDGPSTTNTAASTDDKGKAAATATGSASNTTATTTTSSSNLKQTISNPTASSSLPADDPDAQPATAVRTKSNSSALKKPATSEQPGSASYKLDEP